MANLFRCGNGGSNGANIIEGVVSTTIEEVRIEDYAFKSGVGVNEHFNVFASSNYTGIEITDEYVHLYPTVYYLAYPHFNVCVKSDYKSDIPNEPVTLVAKVKMNTDQFYYLALNCFPGGGSYSYSDLPVNEVITITYENYPINELVDIWTQVEIETRIRQTGTDSFDVYELSWYRDKTISTTKVTCKSFKQNDIIHFTLDKTIDVSSGLIINNETYEIVGDDKLSGENYIKFDGEKFIITGGTQVYINGVKQNLKSISLEEHGEWVNKSALPYNLYNGCAIVNTSKNIEILGSEDGGYYTLNYERIGTTWSSKSTLPYGLFRGSAIVNKNGNLEVLGGDGSGLLANYERIGTTWTEKSTLPYQFGYSDAVLNSNGNIEILGSDISTYYTSNYERIGTIWTNKTTLPYAFYQSCSIVNKNNNIEIVGSQDYSNRTSNYERVGTIWSSKSTLPYAFYRGSAIVNEYGNAEIFGGEEGAVSNYERIDTIWSSKPTLPYAFHKGSVVVNNFGNVEILGGYEGQKNNYERNSSFTITSKE